MYNHIIKILESESNAIKLDLIHIYREKDKWYAYERSAFLLSELLKEYIVLDEYVVDQAIWLARAEINIEQIPQEYIIYQDSDEYILNYSFETNLYNWISNFNRFQ